MDQQNQTAPVAPTNGEKKVGPIIATLIIVLVLIIAALYIFASKISQPSMPDDAATTADTSGASGATSVSPVTGTSTDVDNLQKDLNSATQGLDNQNF